MGEEKKEKEQPMDDGKASRKRKEMLERTMPGGYTRTRKYKEKTKEISK